MKKILLIEDDEVMRENTQEILELVNYEVFTASNGKEGIKQAKEIKPDLIISDIMMPELDGHGVLHILSKDPETATIPFIFLTAKAERTDMRRGMDLGADDYLTKPFEDSELLSAVESRLKKNELIQKHYEKNKEGLHLFLKDASNLTELHNLSLDKMVTLYKKKEIIYRTGDEPQYIYFLNKGKIKTSRMNDEGKEYITNVFSSGDFFGYIVIFENTPYNDNSTALEDCEVCKIPKKDFLSLVSKNSEISSTFIKMLSGNIVQKEKQLLSLAYSAVRKRVAEALLLVHSRYKGNNLKENTSFSITREDLASLVGTATETLIRCLSELKEAGLIEVKGRSISILKPKELLKLQ